MDLNHRPLSGDHRPGARGVFVRTRSAGRLAFTLIEIILAISIAVGLLVGAIWFYRQAAEYRNQLLQHADQLSAIRLVTDQLAGDLRAAQADGRHAFTGDSNSVQFAKASVPGPISANSLGGAGPETDLHRVSYRAIAAMDGTNVTVRGITREEQILIDALVPPQTRGMSTLFTATDAANRVEEPGIESIHHLSFRYWDGSTWLDSWNSFSPPAGVEVTLSPESLPTEGLTPESGIELFRRVIDVPAGMIAQRSLRNGIGAEPTEAP